MGSGYATLPAWSPASAREEPPAVTAAVERSADAPVARTAIARLVEAEPLLADELVATPLLLDGVVALACASRALTSAVIADPSLLDWLRDPDGLARERTPEQLPRGRGRGTFAHRTDERRHRRPDAAALEAVGGHAHRAARPARAIRPPHRRP